MIVTFGRKRQGLTGRIDPTRWMGCRELDSRDSAGLTVRLLWDRHGDQVLVHVRDIDLGVDFVLSPPKAQARYAFQHPFGVAHMYASVPSQEFPRVA